MYNIFDYQVVKINMQDYADKVRACWIGKNIGGTMGAPFEGRAEMNDITGYTTPKGSPLPNDDLDLQLVWLKCLEDKGPFNFCAADLADYWTRYITPAWNEYGIGKANMKLGLLPPYSGSHNNDLWKTSNGAWIRSEIWACLSAGLPALAVKFAYFDACCDHGLTEGTYAEIFTATLQSAAFRCNDLRKLVDIAFGYIPADCRVARAVKLAIECYDNKVDFVEARNKIVEDSKDLGMFQAPANVAFVILGLLYGEGDFKKSMCLAINCGDDTDCTGATIGALMGIMGGTKVIPTDWQEYIGDEIVTCCIAPRVIEWVPETCSDLTKRVVGFMPTFYRAFNLIVEPTDGESDYGREMLYESTFRKRLFDRSEYCMDVRPLAFGDATVDYGKEPRIKAGEDFTFRIKFYPFNRFLASDNLTCELYLPEGWTAEYKKDVMLVGSSARRRYVKADPTFNEEDIVITVRADSNIKPVNRLVVMLTMPGNPIVETFPVTFLG